jgi:hypothetical protein
VGEFSLAVTFRNVEDHFTWAFVGVYSPNSVRDKGLIWDELVVYSASGTCLGAVGDVIVSRFLSESLGEACLCPAMVEFFDFIFY